MKCFRSHDRVARSARRAASAACLFSAMWAPRALGEPPPDPALGASYGVSLSVMQSFGLSDSPPGSGPPGAGAGKPPPVIPAGSDFGPPDMPPPPRGRPGAAPPDGGPPPPVAGPATPGLVGGGTATLLGIGAGFLPSETWTFSLSLNGLLPGDSPAGPAGSPRARVAPGDPAGTGAAAPAAVAQAGAAYRPDPSLRLRVAASQILGSAAASMRLPPSPDGAGPSDPAAPPETTAFLAAADLALSRAVMLSASAPFGLVNGPADPSLALRVGVPVVSDRNERLFLSAAVQATAPFSTSSQQQQKITTVTGTLNPSYRNGAFQAGLTSFVSYRVYSPDARPAAPRGPPLNRPPFPPGGGRALPPPLPPGDGRAPPAGASGPPAPDLVTVAHSLSLGLRLGRAVALVSSAGVAYSQAVDDTVSWSTQAIPLRLALSLSSVSLSASVTLASDPRASGEIAVPTVPTVGVGLTCFFGSPLALIPAGSLPMQ